ncbi:MAG: NAD(+) synthase [Oscillospiraceae bacterium]|nr:NAD(+) synthase [Oscillospiraceae bacterium]
MRDYTQETASRVEFIRSIITKSGADGLIYANSGGKDAVLTGILCKKACADTVGLILPCGSKQNYGSDKADAEAVAKIYGISTRYIDLAGVQNQLLAAIGDSASLSATAVGNIAPRLRMATLYAIGASENRLVAGTGNRSERYMGYFTKWGDGAFDFNPIADLTVTEVYEFLRSLGAPESIINKAPSAGLYDGQTDEGEMGVTYRSIDDLLLSGATNAHDLSIIEKFHRASRHKRKMPPVYPG